MDNGSDMNSILNLTQKLLDSISGKDWETYVSLVDEKFTAIEKETDNNIVDGLEFHKFYFDLPNNNNISIKETIVQPVIKITGDVAIICYKRLRIIANAVSDTVKNELIVETRVWKKNTNIGLWKMIHFHKSLPQ